MPARGETGRESDMKVIRSVIVLWTVLLSVWVQAQTAPPSSKTEVRLPAQALLGAWRLISIDYASPQGAAADDTFGPNPAGLIVYDRSGWMSVQIVTGNRPKMERPESRTSGVVTAEQVQLSVAAFNSYYAYFGKWDFDEQTSTVTHHLQSSLLPWETGLDLHRQASLDGDRLTLLARYSRHGVDYVRTLVWQRLLSSDK
jgi:hypothetical protein